MAQREDGLNVRGALDAAGNEVIPFQYGDIRFLSERWALGVTLEETSIRPCDYEDYIDGKDYNAIAYDVYDLSGRGYVGFFSYQCKAICAHGDYPLRARIAPATPPSTMKTCAPCATALPTPTRPLAPQTATW